MFVERFVGFCFVLELLQSIITNKIIGFNGVDITFNFGVLSFGRTIVWGGSN